MINTTHRAVSIAQRLRIAVSVTREVTRGRSASTAVVAAS